MFTEDLYESTKDIWEKLLVHPFVQGIKNGDLDREKFKFYMVQDYLYLWDYAKLFAIGALKSENPEVISSFAQAMDYTINGEMGIHRSYMERLGIPMEEVDQMEPSLITLSYTNYMLSVAQKGGYEEVVAALLSCAWTYADIARAIDQENPQAQDHLFYGEWVSGYIDEDFQETAQTYKDQMDEIGENLSEERKDFLTKVFRNCCIYELKFWDMAWERAEDFIPGPDSK